MVARQLAHRSRRVGLPARGSGALGWLRFCVVNLPTEELCAESADWPSLVEQPVTSLPAASHSNVSACPYAVFTFSETRLAGCPVYQVKNILKEVRRHGTRTRGGVGDPVDC
jgi:hypothetical protein